nr:reverse transcriptase domain-containing protein [Tanacetum cinerariifolium]
MHTRSKFYPNNSNATIPRRSNRRRVPNIVEPEILTIEDIVPMADRTMEELLQAPTEGYGEAIVILEILAENFEIKTNLLQDVPYDAIKLMPFSYSLEGAAKFWYEKEPPNSILTWDDLERFKEMLRACPYHGFSKLTKIDTFYNGLNEQDQDSLNAAAGGNLLSKTTREALKIIENKFEILNLVEIVNKQVITSAFAKAFEKTYVTCGGAHAYYDCIATDSNQPSVCAATGSYNQVSPPNRASHQIPPPDFASVQNNLNRFNQNQGQGNNFQGNNFQNNKASTLGTLLSNTMPNPKGEMKSVTTRSGLAYEGPLIPANSPFEKVVEQDTKEITKKEHSNCQGSTAHVQPLVVPISILKLDVLRTHPKPTIPYPSRLNDQKLRMDVCHALANLGASINLMPLLIWKKLSLPELTPTQMTLELADRSITCPKGVTEDVFVKVGKFHYPTDFMVVDFEADPRVPLILGRSFLRIGRALIDVYGEEITLRVNDESVTFNLNQTMRYSSTYDDTFVNRVDVIDIACEEFVQDVLDFKYNPKSSNPTLVSDPLIFESDPCKEVIKLLDAGKIYPISDSPWVSPIHCVPKKGGMTVVANENKELIPMRLVTGWRVCIDYRKLNDATRKDHFLLPFMDQMLERLAGNELYCFLDGFLGYFQIPIDPQDQEKTTFTSPYGTFSYCRMTFGLCNAPIDYLSKWVEAKALPTNDARVVVKFLKSLFSWFGIPRAIISDRGTHFCNDQFNRVMIKYGVTHQLATAYHPQMSGQVEVSNHGLKRILERTTLIGWTPYKPVYGKSCHLPIELEHRAYWALKHINFDLKTVGYHRKLQLNELSELRDQANENSVIYKERTKKLHDSKIKNRIFNVGDQVSLFNSHLKIFFGKLKTRWSGPSTITHVFPYGTVELSQPNGPNFKVNGHRVKHYFEGDIPSK